MSHKQIKAQMDVIAAAGELGQVGGATYLHGFTAAIGVLRPSDPRT